MKNYKLQVPEGVLDYIDQDINKKELIEGKIKDLFLRFNYKLIETPTFEYLDVFQEDKKTFQETSLYHLTNRQGELMALKSDMTRAISRVVATQKKENVERFTYLTNTFRYPARYQGKLHEFTQAGIELIGDNSINADFEVIYLAISALKEIGLKEFSIHIGSSEFLTAMMEGLNFYDDKQKQILEYINTFDAVGLKKFLTEQNVDKDMLAIFVELIESVGKIDLLLNLKSKIKNDKALVALNKLEKLYNMISSSGLEKYVLFDFSVLSFGNYYTGISFQGFAKGVGFRILEGGRYDGLIKSFGFDKPAVGFAIYLNYLINLIELPKQKEIILLGYSDNVSLLSTVLEKYKDYRIQMSCDDVNKCLEYAKEKGIKKVVFITDEIKEYTL